MLQPCCLIKPNITNMFPGQKRTRITQRNVSAQINMEYYLLNSAKMVQKEVHLHKMEGKSYKNQQRPTSQWQLRHSVPWTCAWLNTANRRENNNSEYTILCFSLPTYTSYVWLSICRNRNSQQQARKQISVIYISSYQLNAARILDTWVRSHLPQEHQQSNVHTRMIASEVSTII
jgi:hypothetical protein